MNSLASENTKTSKTWPRVKLGAICEINLGKTPPRGNGRFWDVSKTSGFKWLSISDLLNSYDGKVNDSKEYITEAAVYECGVPVVKKGTFLLSFKLTLGRTAIAGCDLYTNEAIAALPLKSECKGEVDLVYLSYYCKYFDWDEFASRDEKVLGKTLNKKKLAEVPVYLPPLTVQHEIVARLEKDLAAVARMAKGFEALKAEADQLFKSTLRATFEEVSRGGAETRRLGEVCTLKNGYTPKVNSLNPNKGVPYFRVGAMSFTGNEKFLVTPNAYCDEKGKRIFPQGTVVFPKNGGAAQTHKVRILARKSIVDLNTGVAMPGEMSDSDYLYYWFVNFPINSCIVVGAIPFVDFNMLGNMEFPLPPLPTQRKIVAKLDVVRERCEKLKRAAEEGLQASALMRKAILKEAFA